MNTEIDNALKVAESKSGGLGGNQPDAKLILKDSKTNYYPVMIEYKGHQKKLEKLDKEGYVANSKRDDTPNYKNINGYAVNGAVHYANAILQYTSFTDVIAIGVTGYKDSQGKLQLEYGVYYVSKYNYGIGQKIGDYTDLSFLKPENFDKFIEQVERLSLSDAELKHIQQKREDKIEDALTRINERLYTKQKNISALARIHLVSASIMASLGVPNEVKPLETSDLKSSTEEGNTDGEIIKRKIQAFLKHKKIPQRKQEQIVNSLSLTILDDDLSKPINGVSLIKDIFNEVVEDLGYFYKVGLDTDFTGKLFNIMFRWLSFAGDDQNDVVLTPRYVAVLMARLARINKDSHVWDFATGSAGLLVAAMNIMLQDARETIHSPDELKKKEMHIKTHQILGLEVLPEIYMLAVLNMILMGDGSSNILQGNSLTGFDGKYGYGKDGEVFPADAFLLNPPYSEGGNGMNFVETALNLMNSKEGTKKGYAVVIIQDSAGNGKATEYNKRILKQNTLTASIKMPIDLFIGKSNVPTSIYVFKVGEKHDAKYPVRFIDLRDDGYKRADRKKAKASSNLKDVGNAIGRYQEVADLVKFGGSQLNLLSEENYVEDTIDPNSGNDWNFDQHIKIDGKPHISEFDKTVTDFLTWETIQLIHFEPFNHEKTLNQKLEEIESNFLKDGGEFNDIKMEKIFKVKGNPQLNKESFVFSKQASYPYFTRSVLNNGISGYVEYLDDDHKISGNCLAVGMMGMQFFYMEKDFYAGQFTKSVYPIEEFLPVFNSYIAQYFTTSLNRFQSIYQGGLVRDFESLFNSTVLSLPYRNNKIDTSYMEKYIKAIKSERLKKLHDYIEDNKINI